MHVSRKPQLKSLTPHENVGVLLLVENSLAMSNIWNEVRYKYLAPLGATLQTSNGDPSSSMTILLESMSAESAGRVRTVPRRCSSFSSALGSVRFCPNPRNAITDELISQSIDVLSSVRIPGHPSTLHLVIVAASPVCPEIKACAQSSGRSPEISWWNKQACQLREAGIQFHLVRRPNQDTAGIELLFNAVMKLQNIATRKLQPPPISASREELIGRTEMEVRLAVPKPGGNTGGANLRMEEGPSTNNGGRFGAVHGSGVSGDPSRQAPHRILLSRHDPFATTIPSSSNISTKPTRSLSIVARLQEVHGLTKKKLYGPTDRPQVRTPFFKEERVGDTPPQTPLPPLIPPEVQEYIKQNYPLPSSGGKAQTRSTKERKGRLAQRNATSPPRASRREKKPLTPDHSLAFPSSTHRTAPLAQISPATRPVVSPTDPTINNTLIGPSVNPSNCAQGLSHHPRPNDPRPAPSGTQTQQPRFLASPPSPSRVDYLPYACKLPTNDPVSTYIGPNVSPLEATTPSPRTGEMGSPFQSHVQSSAVDAWAQLDPFSVPPFPPRWCDYQGTTLPSSASGAYGEGGGRAEGEQFYSTEPYFPFTELLYPGHPNPNTEYMSISPVAARTSPTNTAISVGSCGTDGTSVNAEVTLASQPLGLNNVLVAGTEPLPQFYPSSSSSLSAMINPRIDVCSPSGGGNSAGSVYHPPEGM